MAQVSFSQPYGICPNHAESGPVIPGYIGELNRRIPNNNAPRFKKFLF